MMRLFRNRPILEQAAFVVCLLNLSLWTFRSELVQTRWKRYILAFYKHQGPQAGLPPYTGAYAVAEYAAASLARGMEKNLQDRDMHALLGSPIKYRTGELQALYRPINMGKVAQNRSAWISMEGNREPVALYFDFPGGQSFSRVPRVIVVAEPAEAFVGNPAILFWSVPGDPGHFSSHGPSLAATFQQQGGLAVALFPVARLVEWHSNPVVARLRLDVVARNNGRVSIVGPEMPGTNAQ